MTLFFASAPEAHQKIERKKAQELKKSAWWKQQLGKSKCYHCEERFAPTELTMDHLVPIARGGFTDKKNCVPACKSCNTQRKYFLPSELALKKIE